MARHQLTATFETAEILKVEEKAHAEGISNYALLRRAVLNYVGVGNDRGKEENKEPRITKPDRRLEKTVDDLDGESDPEAFDDLSE